jgi:hypothetical protein
MHKVFELEHTRNSTKFNVNRVVVKRHNQISDLFTNTIAIVFITLTIDKRQT